MDFRFVQKSTTLNDLEWSLRIVVHQAVRCDRINVRLLLVVHNQSINMVLNVCKAPLHETPKSAAQ